MDVLKGNNYFVYILTNKTKTVLYIGVTSDITVRIYYHKNPGLVEKMPFTTKYKCYYLIYYERFQFIDEAILREKQLKRWRREKKEWLINGFNPDWNFLNDLTIEW